MVVLGLILIGLGAVAIVAALFTAEGSNVELLGTDISAVALFFVGLAAGLAILWGFGFTKWGAKRTIRQRRESKELNELHEKLERREAEQRKDADGRDQNAY
jgi:ABC-type Na+ efflux pump permease subunit